MGYICTAPPPILDISRFALLAVRGFIGMSEQQIIFLIYLLAQTGTSLTNWIKNSFYVKFLSFYFFHTHCIKRRGYKFFRFYFFYFFLGDGIFFQLLDTGHILLKLSFSHLFPTTLLTLKSFLLGAWSIQGLYIDGDVYRSCYIIVCRSCKCYSI